MTTLPRSLKSTVLRFAPIATLCVHLPTRAAAQAAPEPASETEQPAAVVLDPFVVDTSADKGYDTANTLSGTRLNSPSKYVGSAITDVSPQLMADLSLTNVQDLINFMPNSSSYFGGGVNTDPNGNNGLFGVNYISRGFAVTTVSRDFLNWRVPDDQYNTERFSDDRGPNSLLFGIGNPGGILNSVSKRAQMRDFYEDSVRGDTNGSRRGSFDVNQMIVKDKLAIRVDGLSEDAMTNRHPSDRIADRLYGAITAKPFSNTTITVNGEMGKLSSLNVRPWPASDGISSWIAKGSQPIPSNLVNGQTNYASTGGVVPAGSPSVATNTAQLNAAGFESQYTSPGELMVTGSAQNLPLLDASGFVFTQRPAAPDGTLVNTLLNSPIPYKDNILGYGNKLVQNFGNFTVNIEQRVFDNLFLQATINRQQTNNWNDYSSGSQDNIYIDKNPTLYTWNGQVIANPNYNQYFSEVNGSITSYLALYTDQTARLTASDELDLRDKVPGIWGKILGHHNFAALREQDTTTYLNTYAVLRNITLNQNNGAGIPASALTSIQNNDDDMQEIHYFYTPSSAGNVAMPDLLLSPFPKVLYDGTQLPAANANGVTPAWVANSSVQSLTHINTQMVVDQNYFWDDKIVTTFGVRRDVEDIWNVTTRNNAANDSYTVYAGGEDPKSLVAAPLGEVEQIGQTATEGVVVTPLKWFGLFYNHSLNFIPSGTQADIFDRPLTNGQGVGKDFGIKFFLAGDRLSATFDRYTTNYDNVPTTVYRSGSTNLSAVESAIVSAMNNTAIGGPGGAMWSGTYPGWDSGTRSIYTLNNEDSEGDEVTITANPTNNWRITANASYQHTVNTDYGQTEAQWLNGFAIPYFQANPQYLNLLTGSGLQNTNETIAQRLQDAQTILTLAQSLNGKADARQAQWGANLVTGYDFTGPFLRNVGVGGTYQWRSKMIIGYPFANGTTTLYNTAHPYYSDPTTNVGLFVNYKFKLLRSITKVQLNVNGITSTSGLRPYSEQSGPNGNTEVIRYFVGPGTSAALTVTQDF